MEFSDWITRKYIEWRGDAIGNNRSISDFARAIGVSQPLLSQWMRKDGKVPENQKTVSKLAGYFGDEIYDVLGLPVPGLSPRNSELYVSASRELTHMIRERGVDPDDPEFVDLVVEVFEKHGVKVQRTD